MENPSNVPVTPIGETAAIPLCTPLNNSNDEMIDFASVPESNVDSSIVASLSNEDNISSKLGDTIDRMVGVGSRLICKVGIFKVSENWSVLYLDILKNNTTHWAHKPAAHMCTLELSQKKKENDPYSQDVPDLLEPPNFWTKFQRCTMRATPNGPNQNKTVRGRSYISIEILHRIIPANASDDTIRKEI